MKYKIKVGDSVKITYGRDSIEAWDGLLRHDPHMRFTDYTHRDLEEIKNESLEEYLFNHKPEFG